MNHDAIDAGVSGIVEVKVPAEWKNAADTAMGMPAATGNRKDLVDYVNKIQIPVNAQEGDKLPVSAFKDMPDGTFPQGSAAYEKRGIAVDVPAWNSENCIQCNFCAYVCPHAVIRPVAMTDDELAKAPAGAKEKALKMTGVNGMNFVMTVSALDCTGCGSCANVCPGKKGAKARYAALESQLAEQNSLLTASHFLKRKRLLKSSRKLLLGFTVPAASPRILRCLRRVRRNSYAKLVTQLFGDRMYIANATGCSSIWGGLHHLHHIQLTRTARVLLGLTHCLKITLSTATVCSLHRTLSVREQ